MSTIPLTFNQRQIAHTALGGREKNTKVLMPVSCLVLNRTSNQYRSRVFKNLLACGFESIVSVEFRHTSRNTEQLAAQFPTVKFICVQESVTVGDLINVGMAEIESPYVLLVQEDMCIDNFKFNATLANKLMEFGQFCVCPRLMTDDMQGLPVRFMPSMKDFQFDVDSSLGLVDKAATMYPVDLNGFYDYKKFVQLGGFDYTITSPYWQKTDLFFRAWLWGEKVNLSAAFSLSYSGEVPIENRTTDISYLMFYLKNILPAFKNDHGEISLSSFWRFHSRSSCGINEAARLFFRARKWVKVNRYRFKMDAVSLMENWGTVGEIK